MADLLPDAPTPPGPWPRDWHEYSNYQVVHERHMEALASEGVVVHETLRFLEIFEGTDLIEVNLVGRLETLSGGIVSVDKWLTVDDRDGRFYVRTREYSYHAWVRFPAPRRDLFRYDNSHGDFDTLHRHCFNVDGGEHDSVAIKPEWMPPLADVIREAEFLARYLRRIGS
jgi:uncharacterized protein DUF6516